MKKSDTEQTDRSVLNENRLSHEDTAGELNRELQEIEEEPGREEQFYEQRRKERHERILRRRKRQIRTGIWLLLFTALAVLGALGYFYGDRIGLKKGMETLVAQVKDLIPQKDTSESKANQSTGNQNTGNGNSDESNAPVDDGQTGQNQGDQSVPTVTQASIEDTQNTMPQAAAAGAGIISRQLRHEKKVLTTAKTRATQYDYDGAISLLQNDNAYVRNVHFQEAAEKYQKKKDKCVAWSPEQVTHIFYHSLIVDTSKAFDGDYKQDGYNQVMTTMEEFNKITQIMYDEGYVMVNLYDLAGLDENGNMKAKEIYLPKGKTPFVLSQDDVCYYHSQDGDGIATKLVVDEDGKVRNEYVQDDGSTVVGDYDVVPLIDRFVEEHPDFAYHGHKGIVALTGYNGILGYRTDISYQTRPDDLNDDKKAWLNAHPDFDLETERAGAKEVADAMKAEGWTFASHTWGHKNMSTVSMEQVWKQTPRL